VRLASMHESIVESDNEVGLNRGKFA